MGKYVTLIEIGKKQNYIFKSNKLAENIGASNIIKYVTEKKAKKFYEKYSPKIIYEGGGNALYVFQTKNDGIEFAKSYSANIIEEYPGLMLYITGYELKEGECVKAGISECHKLLSKKKNQKRGSCRIIDFGNTVRCTTTNLPAFGNLNEKQGGKAISKESFVKYKMEKEIKSDFDNLIQGKLLSEKYQFSKNLDDLGRSIHEKSYIAIVHIDGNGMGSKMQKLNDRISQKSGESLEQFDNRYMEELENFSRKIRESYESAFKEMLDVLAENMEKIKEKLDIKDNNLPIRPLILAGDDVCFVCDGRLGIELSRIYLEKIKNKNIDGTPLNACAGIAIVKAHFPFSRAYEIAEQLCQNAKKEIKDGEDQSLLDWHIEQGELSTDLKEIRAQYVADDKSLLNLRPYILCDKEHPRSLEHFYDAFEIVTNESEDMKRARNNEPIPRNKIKGYYDIIRRGRLAVLYYIKSNLIENEFRCTHNLSSKNMDGYIKIDDEYHNMFFDAIEIMNLLERLEG